ncbi:2012_t:CDS:2 [Funneliformis caledonium]|uniref:2012_t:CDS:1 n=1 Tax=Funneliformis caledonium TaxID=1117310 RepID=A0A9N8ZHY5_9GLOM|nr:2012_t:CDS:2 [Funneliformis caledonium]
MLMVTSINKEQNPQIPRKPKTDKASKITGPSLLTLKSSSQEIKAG